MAKQYRSIGFTTVARLITCAFIVASTGLQRAEAQPAFSIDFQGPPKGVGDTCPPAFPITEGDILIAPFGLPPAIGPLAAPCIAVSGGPTGLGLPVYPPAPIFVGPAGVPEFVEVDALSYGRDALVPFYAGFLPAFGPAPTTWYFSVDEFAIGLGPGTELAADVFGNALIGPGPMCVPLPAPSVLIFDGNGLPLPLIPTPGLGLTEPPFPLPPPPALPGIPDPFTNLDALEMDTPPVTFPIYFSLDSGFVDPAEAVVAPPNTGSAAANGPFVGASVLVTAAPGGPPMGYAPAFMLGLDLFGVGTDDLDALALYENRVAGYQPPPTPFDTRRGFDHIFFSVRRGSGVIGVPDSLCGMPITAGDILVPPPMPGLPPGIWIPGAALGLAPMDDLDALDVTGDCNTNGTSDSRDTAAGAPDCNSNFIPDICEKDCNTDGRADECEPDCNTDFVIDVCAPDCNTNGSADDCELIGGAAADCNTDLIIDACELVAIGDCNTDGTPDVCNVDGFLAFNPTVQYATPWADERLLLADLDGDGDLDVVVAGGVSGRVTILRNNGDGTLAAPVVILVSAGPGVMGIAAADLDGDGDRDLAVGVAGAGPGSVAVLLNSGTGTFAAPVNYAIGGAATVLDIASADFDADGDVDLAVAGWGCGCIVLLRNGGNGTFAAPISFAGGIQNDSLAAGDLDLDGDMDLAVGDSNGFFGSPGLHIYYNLGGAAGFAPPMNYLAVPGTTVRSLCLADLDRDGYLDIITGHQYTNEIRVMRSLGAGGGFMAPVAYANNAGGGVLSVAAGDFNGDDDVDIAAANNGAPQFELSLFLNNGSGGLGTARLIDAGSFVYAVAAGGLNSDDLADLIISSSPGVNVRLSAARGPRSVDCNTDGGPDECEIAANPLMDCDNDGELNVCELVGNACPPGDMTSDGRADGDDIAPFLACRYSGAVAGLCAAADLDDDGDVDDDDLALFVAILLGP